ncbi:MAG: hypothetical protein CL678_15450 [Bdellovibrionaceae bacterium]|nr:hypothetical protein [Pseudobdellovibrionaceae bacterium]
MSYFKTSLESTPPPVEPTADQIDPANVQKAIAEGLEAETKLREAENSAAALESIAVDLQALLDRGDVTNAERGLTTLAINRHLEQLGEEPVDPMADLTIAQESLSDTIRNIWEKIKELARKVWAVFTRILSKLKGSAQRKAMAVQQANLKKRVDTMIPPAKIKEMGSDPVNVRFEGLPDVINLSAVKSPNDIVDYVEKYFDYMDRFVKTWGSSRKKFLNDMERICILGVNLKAEQMQAWVTSFNNMTEPDSKLFTVTMTPAVKESPVVGAAGESMVGTDLLFGTLRYGAARPTIKMMLGFHGMAGYLRTTLSPHRVRYAKSGSTPTFEGQWKPSEIKDFADSMSNLSTHSNTIQRKLDSYAKDVEITPAVPAWIEVLGEQLKDRGFSEDTTREASKVYDELVRASKFYDKALVEHMAHFSMIQRSIVYMGLAATSSLVKRNDEVMNRP